MRDRWWDRWRALARRFDPARLVRSDAPAALVAADVTDVAPTDVVDAGPGIVIRPVAPPGSGNWRSSETAALRAAHSRGAVLSLRREFTATCAKDLAAPSSNEDAHILRLGQKRAAVFDGATESFAARRWSRLLAHYWARAIDADWVSLARDDYARDVDAMALSWAQEAAVERGSYATIIAADARHGILDITAIGDSCAFLLDGDMIVWSHPFESADQFTSAPEALGTRPDLAAADTAALARGHVLIDPGTWNATRLLLATDALSAWLLTPAPDQRRHRVRELLQCQSQDDFVTLVAQARSSGDLKVDDCTVVILALEGPR